MTLASQRYNHIGRLKDFCQVGDGAHASIARQEHGVMYLSAKNFKSSGLDLSNVDYISEGDYEKHFGRTKIAVTTPVKGDVLFGIIGSLGTPYTVKENDRFGLSSSVAILRPSKELCPDYLYLFMTSSAFQSAVHAIKSGVAQGFLSLEMVKNLPLVTHEINIQRKIAATLSAYNELIDNNKRRIALLEKMAEEIYREWFVRLRFPEHKKVKFIKGIPEGWEIQRIGQLFNTSSGGTPSREIDSNFGGDIGWIKTGELKSTFVLDAEERITQLGLENSSAKVYPRHTIVIAMYCAMPDISILAVDSATNQACCAFFPKKDYLHYTYSYLLIKFAQKHLINFAHGAAQQNLSQNLIKGFPLLTPTKDLIVKFSKVAWPIFVQVEQLMRANTQLQRTRDLLLPRLISGKLSVENLDIQFPPGMEESAHEH